MFGPNTTNSIHYNSNISTNVSNYNERTVLPVSGLINTIKFCFSIMFSPGWVIIHIGIMVLLPIIFTILEFLGAPPPAIAVSASIMIATVSTLALLISNNLLFNTEIPTFKQAYSD